MKDTISWEQAVLWLRTQPEQESLVKACYFDDPLLEAAERFSSSEEWLETRNYLPSTRGSALDLGAGRGISSYALAKLGWKVTALEPDASDIVGAGAIRSIAEQTKYPILVVEDWGEKLPFDDNSFDLMYGRQVLHHAADLNSFCRETYRVLRPGGKFIATREHVLSQDHDLQKFLDGHPLHFLYGGENAYLLSQYTRAIQGSGLKILKTLGSFDSVINYFPQSYQDWLHLCTKPLRRRLGTRLSSFIIGVPFLGNRIVRILANHRSKKDNTPGRLYSFICEKPLH